MSDPNLFELAARATDEEAARLCAWLDTQQDQAIIVSAKAVRRLSVPVLQVLICAKRQWQDDGAPFTFQDPSNACTESLAALGLDPAFFEKEAI